MPGNTQVLRNTFCGACAVVMIALGQVRRAHRQALRRGVVTALYFHKPNKRLFARCVRWLSTHGYSFISTSELIEVLYRGKEPPAGAVWLSFDDGCREVLDDVLPLARELSLPIALFIPSKIIEGDGLYPWLHRDLSARGATSSPEAFPREAMTVAQLKEIAEYSYVTIGSHTVGHVVTDALDDAATRRELGESKRVLEAWVERPVVSFAYPEGRYSGRERQVLAELGYTLAVTTDNARISSGTDPFFVPRFSIGDEISYAEAICNMVGVWRSFIEWMKGLLHFDPAHGFGWSKRPASQSEVR